MVLSKMNIQTLCARVTRFNPYGFLAILKGFQTQRMVIPGKLDESDVGVDFDGPKDKESLTVDDRREGDDGIRVNVVGSVGVAVCTWQLPLVNVTSSMAKSPVEEDPAIPSNVT